MLKINAKVHRFLSNPSGVASGSALTDTLCLNLKDEVTELYRIWEESNERFENKFLLNKFIIMLNKKYYFT